MSDAELVIRLVGDATPEESSALETPVASAQRSETTDNRDTAYASRSTRRSESRTEKDESKASNIGFKDAVDNLRKAIDELAANILKTLPDSSTVTSAVVSLAERLQRVLDRNSKSQSDNNKERDTSKNDDKNDNVGTAKKKVRGFLETAEATYDSIAKRMPARFKRGFSSTKTAALKWAKRARIAAKKIGRTRFGKAARNALGKAFPSAGRVAAQVVPQAVAGTSAEAAASAAAPAVAGGSAEIAAGGVAAGSVAAGVAVGAVVAGFVAVGVAALALVKAFNDAGDQLAELSPDVALARAKRQLDTELNMLDRAQRIGPAVGRFENAKAGLNNQLEKLMTDLLAAVARFEPQLSGLVNIGEASILALRALIAAIDRVMGNIDAIIALSTPANQQDDAAAQAKIKQAAQDMNDRLREMNQKMIEALNNFNGNQPNQALPIDPLLQAIMNARI